MSNKKFNEEEILNNILAGITKRPGDKVEDLLTDTKEAIKGVEDVHFRPVDWKGEAVVYVPGWSTAQDTKNIDPRLYKRTFYDERDTSRMDCMVGLVARVARIKEEELMRSSESSDQYEQLKEDVPKEEISNPRYRLNENIENETVFKSFVKGLEHDTNEWNELYKRWREFYGKIKSFSQNAKFFDNVEKANPPWSGDTVKKGQWDQLREILKSPVEENFLQKVKNTVAYYKKLYTQWNNYYKNWHDDGLKKVENPKCEIAVPVIAAGRLLGILNFHREEPFSEEEVKVSLYHAALLAIVLLRNQVELLKNLQKVAEEMTGETSLEKIASEIAKSIRETLVGLEPKDVYPLLYICRRPINTKDDLGDFVEIWKKTYQMRQKPKGKDDLKMWKTENELGPINIRISGLGYKAIKKWKSQAGKQGTLQAKDYFVVSGDVNNPDSDTGSRTALEHRIKTTGCLPLIFSHQVYGLLYLHIKKHHFFTRAELEALETFGVQAAIAINNAKLVGPAYEELYGNVLPDSLIEEDKDGNL